MEVANIPSNPDWRQPPEEQEGLQRYVETIRERIWLIVTAVAITTGIAILYVATATKTYDAEADILVTPVNGTDPTLTSLGLLSTSADPTRDVETAARLVTNINVGDAGQEGAEFRPRSAVAAQFGDRRSRSRRATSSRSPPGLPRRWSDSGLPTPSRTRRSPTAPRSTAQPDRPADSAPAGRTAADRHERAGTDAAGGPDRRARGAASQPGPDDARADQRRPAHRPIGAAAGAQRRRRDHRRADPRRRRRLRRPDPRSAPAPRGAAAAQLPAADPRPHPEGGRRPGEPAGATADLVRHRRGIPGTAGDARRGSPPQGR